MHTVAAFLVLVSSVPARSSALRFTAVACSADLWLSAAECGSVRICPQWKCRLSCKNHLCTLDTLQTLWVVSQGCRLSTADRVWWEKRNLPPHTVNGSLGKKSPNVAMTCQFAIALSAKYYSMSPVWIGDVTQIQQLPLFHQCLFQIRASKVIGRLVCGMWRKHLLLLRVLACSVIYLLQFSLCYQKVEKNSFSSCRQTTPGSTGSRILWGFTYESLKTSGMESQLCGHEVSVYKVVWPSAGKFDINDIIRGLCLSQRRRFSSGSLTCTNPCSSSVIFILLIIFQNFCHN